MGLTKFIFFKIMGWKIEGSFDPSIKKAVVIVVPHTSWHDFFIGVFTRRILKTEINFVAKKELFRWPFGWYFRWMGGAPLDRTSGQNKVEAIAEVFRKKEEFRLALAPEGTRKKVEAWKTGFYYIAQAAHVPIIPVSFDYATKTVTINPPFYISGDIDEDTRLLRTYFENIVGKVPEYS
ncbi:MULTISPECIES: 1-acyl-sn-glycerol-3-phosphate acyltransferase [Altibacter]|uniref:1-acyl-sn-glycerol-3-phosphate acyltransferase n=1 Tax=Altibacter TaxID=1535231 RepID=UPI00054ED042|nr:MULTISPECIES: 1-acyl-sn-glycerol-3-phosphate acyltransferase [Altibacter]MCW8980837.1 1-acyl-sn-glycerol-3-phosphate acyltransferase [Altibacter sp.]MCW9036479.1 1-acyl-sn-glycerol-3-phosphate acyltransferase [Altibacter sp.]